MPLPLPHLKAKQEIPLAKIRSKTETDKEKLKTLAIMIKKEYSGDAVHELARIFFPSPRQQLRKTLPEPKSTLEEIMFSFYYPQGKGKKLELALVVEGLGTVQGYSMCSKYNNWCVTTLLYPNQQYRYKFVNLPNNGKIVPLCDDLHIQIPENKNNTVVFCYKSKTEREKVYLKGNFVNCKTKPSLMSSSKKTIHYLADILEGKKTSYSFRFFSEKPKQLIPEKSKLSLTIREPSAIPQSQNLSNFFGHKSKTVRTTPFAPVFRS